MVTPREIDPGDRPLRFIVFGESLVSDIGNPIATSARSILDALAGAGHEVTFLEERGNDACIRLLKLRGSRALRGFGARFPGIQHRTYDLPRGWERTVWVGREAGTADAVIALPGTQLPCYSKLLHSHHATLSASSTSRLTSNMMASAWFVRKTKVLNPTSRSVRRLPG